MNGQRDNRQRFANLLDEVAVLGGGQRMLVEGVEVPRAPVVYVPKILIVGQGRKRVDFIGKIDKFNECELLGFSVLMPAACETETSPRKSKRTKEISKMDREGPC
ncbi:hypothetical protein SAMN05444166_7599 [Singulisphaera sp. GP187]|uniref:hypothetical protein n=1 Tax=Singulisphaera sp. GP187 TaxID=1882752 RepID=UPI00092A3825|nr:hypothetical protein [Singulisphaera sp. GP187]SIO65137.1 hypothetical protein SAMN05444166_7599 [Singulisphaera sp. GP187]